MSYLRDEKGMNIDDKNSLTWYHGSPFQMDYLKKGSSITRNKNLAVAFSHKPSELSFKDNGEIDHNGRVSGYLYCLEEDIREDDLFVHQACFADDPWEWITTRDMKLKLLNKTLLK